MILITIRGPKGKTSVRINVEFFPRTHGLFPLALVRDARFGLVWPGLAPKGGAVNLWLAGVATLRGANSMWSIDATRRMVFPVSTVIRFAVRKLNQKMVLPRATSRPAPTKTLKHYIERKTSTMLSRWRRRELRKSIDFPHIRCYRLSNVFVSSKRTQKGNERRQNFEF